jgi:predicted ABC-type ATPase
LQVLALQAEQRVADRLKRRAASSGHRVPQLLARRPCITR